MVKKIVFSALIALCIYSLGVFAFCTVEPKAEDNTPISLTTVDYRTLDDYLVASGNGTVHYLLFYSDYNDDSIYVKDTVINSVSQSSSIDVNELIEIVDVSQVDEAQLNASISERFGVKNYPFFACVHVEDGSIIIDSVLPYDIDSPLKASELQTWLEENGVYFPA